VADADHSARQKSAAAAAATAAESTTSTAGRRRQQGLGASPSYEGEMDGTPSSYDHGGDGYGYGYTTFNPQSARRDRGVHSAGP